MPQGPIELGGLGNGPFRISNNILDTLYATCIAITDSQEQTLLLITMDLLHAMQGMVADMRKIITEQTGIPGEHIIIAATHTHAGPDIFNPGPKTVDDYIEYCVKRVPLAAFAALEDRKPARIFTGVKELQGMNFVRHYERAARYIREHPAENLTLAALAKISSMDPSYFHKRFTRMFGLTPAQRVLNCRMAAARVALMNRELSLTEVAQRCEFSSQSYFSTCFKRAVGKSPLAYREEKLDGSNK